MLPIALGQLFDSQYAEKLLAGLLFRLLHPTIAVFCFLL